MVHAYNDSHSLPRYLWPNPERDINISYYIIQQKRYAYLDAHQFFDHS